MSHEFDPYHEWLGIPKDEQPPNYYRLLAINLFESQPNVIQNAVDQRMAYLKVFGTGPHSALSQSLLNEVAAAAVCLLDPTKKKAYDDGLRAAFTVVRANADAQTQARSSRATQQDPAPSTAVAPELHAQLDPIVRTTSAGRANSVKGRRIRKKKRPTVPLALQIVLGGAAGLAVGWYLLGLIIPTDPPAKNAVIARVVDEPTNANNANVNRHGKDKKQIDNQRDLPPPSPRQNGGPFAPTATPPDGSIESKVTPPTTPVQPGTPGTSPLSPPSPAPTTPVQPGTPGTSPLSPPSPAPTTPVQPGTPGANPFSPVPKGPASSGGQPGIPSPQPPSEPAQSNEPNTGMEAPKSTDNVRTIVVDLSDKETSVVLLDVTNADDTQVNIVNVVNLPSSYHMDPKDGNVRVERPVDIVFEQPEGIRFRLSLVTRKTVTELVISPLMDFQREEKIDFTVDRAQRAYRSFQKQLTKMKRQLSATMTSYRQVEAWLAAPGLKDLEARAKARQQSLALQGQILAGQQQLARAQGRAIALRNLTELAKKIHKNTEIQFVVQPAAVEP